MEQVSTVIEPTSAKPPELDELIERYGCGPVQFTGTKNALYERHLSFDNVIDSEASSARDRFEALARSVRDVLSQRWVLTEKTYEQRNAKRLYYLSMEFLIGRSLANNVTNLLLDSLMRNAIQQENLKWIDVLEQEIEAVFATQPTAHWVQKLDAAYTHAYTSIVCSPADLDGADYSDSMEYQNSGVQTFAYRHVAVSYRLAANTAYTAYSWFSQLATGGSWQYYQGNQYLFMRGAAWAL